MGIYAAPQHKSPASPISARAPKSYCESGPASNPIRLKARPKSNDRFWRKADIGQIDGKGCFCLSRSERFLNTGCVWLSVMIGNIPHPKGNLPVTTGKWTFFFERQA